LREPSPPRKKPFRAAGAGQASRNLLRGANLHPAGYRGRGTSEMRPAAGAETRPAGCRDGVRRPLRPSLSPQRRGGGGAWGTAS
jgi:hypothetical protein